jgi:hypothetical protein
MHIWSVMVRVVILLAAAGDRGDNCELNGGGSGLDVPCITSNCNTTQGDCVLCANVCHLRRLLLVYESVLPHIWEVCDSCHAGF